MSRKKNSTKKNEVVHVEPTTETVESLDAIGETVDVGDVEIVQSDAELEALAELDAQDEIKMIESATQEITEILHDEQPEVIPTDTIGDMMSVDDDVDLSDLTFGDAVDPSENYSGTVENVEDHAPDVLAMLTEPLESIEQNVEESIEDLPLATVEPEITETDVSLDATEAKLEAIEASDEAAIAASEEPNVSFLDIFTSVTDLEADNMTARVMKILDERAEFEKQKNPNNSSIQNTIARARRYLSGREQGRFLTACGLDPDELMREKHAGTRYNVYAYLKLGDIVAGLTVSGQQISNAVNLACMRSLFRLRKLGITFDKKTAEAATSKQIHIEHAIAKHLFRHTVSAATASTQASSTMQALQTLGVVRSMGSRNPVYEVTGSPLAKVIEEAMAA